MTTLPPAPSTRREALQRPPRTPRRNWERRHFGLAGAITALTIAVGGALVPPSDAERLAAYIEENAQTLAVTPAAASTVVVRDEFSVTPGIAELAAGGTNHDWAKLVLLLAEFPLSEQNVTVMTRWMRQENGPDDWWRRNNPLNNGWGSGGGGGLGRYPNLIVAAENAAEALHGNPGYASIVAALSSSAPTEVTERAIWASPWASGHYANGGHWSYKPVPVVKSPAGTW